MLKGQTVIVTGGAGFIGSCLVARLEKEHCDRIIIVDNLEPGDKWRNLARRHCGLEIHPIGTAESVIEMSVGSRPTVVHLGGISSTTADNVDALVDNNTMGTVNLARLCHKLHLPMLYASSASVYGDGSRGFAESADATSVPLNAYAWSKLNADMILRREGLLDDSSLVGLRFFNVYGPNEYHKGAQSSVVPRFYEQIAETGRVQLFESLRREIPNGMQRRDFVWVGDVVDVIVHFICQGCRPSGIYNVGTGDARSFLDMARAVADVVDIEATVDFIPMPPSLSSHYQYYTEADLSLLRSRGGYTRAFTPLREGVAQYINEYINQSHKYR